MSNDGLQVMTASEFKEEMIQRVHGARKDCLSEVHALNGHLQEAIERNNGHGTGDEG